MESRSNSEEEVALFFFVNFQLLMHTVQLDLYTVSDYCLIKTDVWYSKAPVWPVYRQSDDSLNWRTKNTE